MSVVPTRQADGSYLVQCANWNQFMDAVRINYPAVDPDVRVVFRGHGDIDWPLASVWERSLLERRQQEPSVDRTQNMGVLSRKLEEFKQHAIGLRGLSRTSFVDDVEWWAVGRHHGLITPLLDWTLSPYVAAFFAWTEFFKKLNPGMSEWGGGSSGPFHVGTGVAIWQLTVSRDLRQDPDFQYCDTLTDSAMRQKAQRGVFTYLRHHQHLHLAEHLAARGLSNLLVKYEIPGSHPNCPEALAELTTMNVRYATLFPDLEGAARQANFDAVLDLFRGLVGMTSRFAIEDYLKSQAVAGATPNAVAPESGTKEAK